MLLSFTGKGTVRHLPKIENGEVIVDPPTNSQPQPRRSKKGKKKHQGQASAADYLKVTPLSREADLLREVGLKYPDISCNNPLQQPATAWLHSAASEGCRMALIQEVRRCCIIAVSTREKLSSIRDTRKPSHKLYDAGECSYAAQQVREGAADGAERGQALCHLP
jgi:hypothetical protein